MVAGKKILKQEAMAEVRIVEEILRRWDPIGVKPGVDGPFDEYDSYAPHIVSLVGGCDNPDFDGPSRAPCYSDYWLRLKHRFETGA